MDRFIAYSQNIVELQLRIMELIIVCLLSLFIGDRTLVCLLCNGGHTLRRILGIETKIQVYLEEIISI